jgi:polyphosphate kinase
LAREAKEKLWEVLDVCLRDRRQAWVLDTDGKYSQLRPGDAGEGNAAAETIGSHAALMDLARRRAE